MECHSQPIKIKHNFTSWTERWKLEVEITQDGGQVTIQPPLLKFKPFRAQWLML
jgi:hypothetical protein